MVSRVIGERRAAVRGVNKMPMPTSGFHRSRVWIRVSAAFVVVVCIHLNSSCQRSHSEIIGAAGKGDLATIQKLLKPDPTLVFVKDRKGLTALDYAAMNGHDNVVELLLANKADVHATNENGGQPLHYGACYGHPHIVELMIANKADVNAKDRDTVTPLHCAAYGGYKDVVAILLKNKADINSKDKDGDTALHAAVRNGHKEVVDLLLANGADVNARTISLGLTPLDEAAAYGRTDSWSQMKSWLGDKTKSQRSKDLTELLLDHGSDAKARGKDGWTPLHLAAFWRNGNTAELLLGRGADPNVRDDHGRTPLQVAASSRIKELLRQHGGHE